MRKPSFFNRRCQRLAGGKHAAQELFGVARGVLAGQVRVDPQRNLDVRVAKPLLRLQYIHVGAVEERGVIMAEEVRRQARSAALVQVIGTGVAHRLAEARPFALEGCFRDGIAGVGRVDEQPDAALAAQHGEQVVRYGQDAVGGGRLQPPQARGGTLGKVYVALDVHGLRRPVDVRPLQAKRLTAPQPQVVQQEEQQPIRMRVPHGERGLGLRRRQGAATVWLPHLWQGQQARRISLHGPVVQRVAEDLPQDHAHFTDVAGGLARLRLLAQELKAVRRGDAAQEARAECRQYTGMQLGAIRIVAGAGERGALDGVPLLGILAQREPGQVALAAEAAQGRVLCRLDRGVARAGDPAVHGPAAFVYADLHPAAPALVRFCFDGLSSRHEITSFHFRESTKMVTLKSSLRQVASKLKSADEPKKGRGKSPEFRDFHKAEEARRARVASCRQVTSKLAA